MRQFPISFEINAYSQSVLVPAEVDERPSEIVLEREKVVLYGESQTEARRNKTCENEDQRQITQKWAHNVRDAFGSRRKVFSWAHFAGSS